MFNVTDSPILYVVCLLSPIYHHCMLHSYNKRQKTTELDYILDKYQQRFTGIEKATQDRKEIQITVQIDNATPIAQKPRRIPYQLTKPLKQRLVEFEENDIIKPVSEHEAIALIAWCSDLNHGYHQFSLDEKSLRNTDLNDIHLEDLTTKTFLTQRLQRSYLCEN